MGCASTTVTPEADSPPQKREIVPNIDGFVTIPEYEYPSVGRLLNNSMIPKCSVVLVEEDVVLTAGHCISNDESYVQFGNEIYSIECSIKHPEYDVSSKVRYDIALVFLDTHVRGIKPSKINMEPLTDVMKGTPVVSDSLSFLFYEVLIICCMNSCLL